MCVLMIILMCNDNNVCNINVCINVYVCIIIINV